MKENETNRDARRSVQEADIIAALPGSLDFEGETEDILIRWFRTQSSSERVKVVQEALLAGVPLFVQYRPDLS